MAINNKPANTLRCGSIKATIWENSSENGPFFATTFYRPFKDQSGEWRNGNSFWLNDLEALLMVAREAGSGLPLKPSRVEGINGKSQALRGLPSQFNVVSNDTIHSLTKRRPTPMSLMQKTDEIQRAASILDGLTDIIARKVAGHLAAELKKLYATELVSDPLSTPIIQSTPAKAHGSLWSLNELAADSGIRKGTWYKRINQRKVPAVRLGRSVRVRDEDYRKLIQRSLRPEIHR